MTWYEIINHQLSTVFYSYGKLVARHRRKFLIYPFLLALFLSAGVLFLTFENDAVYLFTPPSSRASKDLEFMQEHFQVSHDNLIPSRLLTTQEKIGNLYITDQNGGNVLSKEIIQDILQLNKDLQSMQVEDPKQGTRFNFSDVCARWKGTCLPEISINFLSSIIVESDNFLVTYPFTYLPSKDLVHTGYILGGVELTEDGIVTSAKAIALSYFLQSGTPEDLHEAKLWEESFTKLVDSYNGSSSMSVSHLTSQSLSDELLAMTERVMPLMIVTFSILCSFAICSCLMSDWVQAKPWLGACGLASAFLAISSTVGLLSACGVAFNQVVASMPFLIIGIGIDDMFIMVAAWRHTDRRLPVEDRMGLAYSDAAVSITITSVTDALAFCIGAITPLPAVRIFCLYAGVAVIFDFIYQITFFGACMVFTGHREANRKHCYTCRKVLPKDEAPSMCYRIWCAGGLSSKSNNNESESEQAITSFFRKYWGPIIVSPVVKISTIAIFIGYLALSIWGCLHVQEGLQIKDIFADDSYARQYYLHQAEYFTDFGVGVSLVFDTEEQYWNENVQKEIESITSDFESSRFIHGSPQYTESWLRDYLTFIAALPNNTNFDQERFIIVLRTDFLKNPQFEKYKDDINFNCERTSIENSRIVLTTTNVVLSTDEMEFMSEMRERADSASLSVTIFSPSFIFIEQYIITIPNTIQALLIATACMFIVSLFLMPHPVCAVMVTICIVTIETGVIGIMSLWEVKLDGISMINVILCIGFSVDFSAHMTYAFITSSGETGNDRAKDALHSLGTPILQGGLSTILGISVLSSSPAYVFRAFFRTMFLVILFGLFHSLLFLPVFLSYLGGILPRKEKVNPSTQRLNHTQDMYRYSPIAKGTFSDSPSKDDNANNAHYVSSNNAFSKSSCDTPNEEYLYSVNEDVIIVYQDRLISLDSTSCKETVL